MEETGVEVGDIVFKALTNDLFEAENKHYLTVWMEGRYVSGEPSVASAYEMSEVAWFRWDSLPSPLFLPFANLLAGFCYPSMGSGR